MLSLFKKSKTVSVKQHLDKKSDLDKLNVRDWETICTINSKLPYRENKQTYKDKVGQLITLCNTIYKIMIDNKYWAGLPLEISVVNFPITKPFEYDEYDFDIMREILEVARYDRLSRKIESVLIIALNIIFKEAFKDLEFLYIPTQASNTNETRFVLN